MRSLTRRSQRSRVGASDHQSPGVTRPGEESAIGTILFIADRCGVIRDRSSDRPRKIAIGLSGAAGCLGTTGGDDVERLEPERELWSFEADGRLPTTPAVASGRIHVASLDRNVYALETEQGTERWRFETGDELWSAPAIDGDTLYVGGVDHRVYAIGLDGDQRWTVETGGEIYAPPTTANDRVYIGSNDGRLYALSSATGEIEWTVEIGGEMKSKLATIED